MEKSSTHADDTPILPRGLSHRPGDYVMICSTDADDLEQAHIGVVQAVDLHSEEPYIVYTDGGETRYATAGQLRPAPTTAHARCAIAADTLRAARWSLEEELRLLDRLLSA